MKLISIKMEMGDTVVELKPNNADGITAEQISKLIKQVAEALDK